MKLSDLITPEDIALAAGGQTASMPENDVDETVMRFFEEHKAYVEVFRRIAGATESNPEAFAFMMTTFQTIDAAIRHATRGQAQ